MLNFFCRFSARWHCIVNWIDKRENRYVRKKIKKEKKMKTKAGDTPHKIINKCWMNRSNAHKIINNWTAIWKICSNFLILGGNVTTAKHERQLESGESGPIRNERVVSITKKGLTQFFANMPIHVPRYKFGSIRIGGGR